MESNIRDKLLVKMIKLQEFTEKKRIAEMLNEMNPKLKALLAAGLIGTAGLGMQSCSNPSDSVYYPYTVEAPSTDNPGSGGAETSNPSGGEENGGNGRETVNKNEVTFEKLGVNDIDAARIAKAGKPSLSASSFNSESLERIKVGGSSLSSVPIFVYIKESSSFSQGIPKDEDGGLPSYYDNGAVGYTCVDNGAIYAYIIPADLENSFKDAIDAYNKASQSNQ